MDLRTAPLENGGDQCLSIRRQLEPLARVFKPSLTKISKKGPPDHITKPAYHDPPGPLTPSEPLQTSSPSTPSFSLLHSISLLPANPDLELSPPAAIPHSVVTASSRHKHIQEVPAPLLNNILAKPKLCPSQCSAERVAHSIATYRPVHSFPLKQPCL
jgi:hypothetical protein